MKWLITAKISIHSTVHIFLLIKCYRNKKNVNNRTLYDLKTYELSRAGNEINDITFLFISIERYSSSGTTDSVPLLFSGKNQSNFFKLLPHI